MPQLAFSHFLVFSTIIFSDSNLKVMSLWSVKFSPLTTVQSLTDTASLSDNVISMIVLAKVVSNIYSVPLFSGYELQ